VSQIVKSLYMTQAHSGQIRHNTISCKDDNLQYTKYTPTVILHEVYVSQCHLSDQTVRLTFHSLIALLNCTVIKRLTIETDSRANNWPVVSD